MDTKGLIILPKWFESRFTDNYKILFYRLCEERGFDIQYTNEPKIPKNCEIVVTHGIPHHNAPDYPIEPFLDFKGRLIGWVRDLQTYGNHKVTTNFKLMFERYDRILQFADSEFKKRWSDFNSKAYYFGQFVAPKERYSELKARFYPKYNSSFLLSGNFNPVVYPLRSKYADPPPELHGKIVVAPGPMENINAPIRKEYARTLNKYMGCLTDCSIYHMALAKHVEIAAAGSLLITDPCDDLVKLGLIPWQDFVPVNPDNMWGEIIRIKNKPWEYDNIRERARSKALEKMTVENRLQELLEIIDDKR